MLVSYENLKTNKITQVKGKRNIIDSLAKISMTFIFDLSAQAKYRVTFSKKGCPEKFVYFDTNLPDSIEGIFALKFKMDLKSKSDSISMNPVKLVCTLFKYQSSTDDFTYVNNAEKYITEILYNIGVEKTMKNEFQDALIDYTEALKFSPGDINSLYNRGIVKLKLNDKFGACQDWGTIKLNGYPDADELIAKYCN